MTNPKPASLIWVMNILRPSQYDSGPVHHEYERLYDDLRQHHVIGPPKATEFDTADELLKLGFNGLYKKGDDGQDTSND